MNSCVYFAKSNGLYKIGVTRNIEKRMSSLSVAAPYIKLIHVIHTEHIYALEKYYHNYFREKRTRGEWFQLSEQDIKNIKTQKPPKWIHVEQSRLPIIEDNISIEEEEVKEKIWLCPLCHFLTDRPGLCQLCEDTGPHYYYKVEKTILLYTNQ